MNDIDLFLEGGDEYGNILSEIRAEVNSICKEFNWSNPNGLIGVNKTCQDNNDRNIYMKVYPFDPEVPKNNIDNEYILQCTRLINEDRPYEVFFHHQNINNKDKRESLEHFMIELDDTQVINQFHDFDWGKKLQKILIANDNNLNLEELNLLDLAYFSANSKLILAVPLPILSTPTFLLIIRNELSKEGDKEELRSFILELTKRTKELIHFYIYNRLINKLTQFIEDQSLTVTSDEDFINLFVSELVRFLLPTQYSLETTDENCANTTKKTGFSQDWPEVDDNIFELQLLNKKASFHLTSYHIPICDEQNKKSDWIHYEEHYIKSKRRVKSMLENIFSLIYKQWKRTIEVKNHATKAATSRIINRNYAHHIGSHVSHRATADKILERIYGDNHMHYIFAEGDMVEQISNLKSVLEMENRLTQYKDERNEFISGMENNTHPVPVFFYKDIIQPFIENSLLMDNIAKSEEICWEFEDTSTNDGKVKADGISKLRIRVFYHKDLINKPVVQLVNENDKNPISTKECCCDEDVPCMYKNNDQGVESDRLSLSELGLDNNWCEMMAIYDLDGNKQQKCIHRLPYFKKLIPDSNKFYHDIDYSLNDIEVAIPGTLGAQSIYSLLENLIRNTAKHGHKVGNNLPVNIIIKISPFNDDYFNMEITSNVITITNDDQIENIKKSLQEKIDIAAALGFADMRINACLLAFRDINDANLENIIKDLHVYPKINESTNSVAKNDTNQQTLGYCMRLTKPCKIVFVGEQYKCFNTREWNNQGFRQYDTAEACIKALGDMPRAFQFAVVQESVLDNLGNCDLLLKSLPWRVLVVPDGTSNNPENLENLIKQRRITDAKNIDLKKEDTADELLEKCWDAWLSNRWEEPFALHMYFENSEELEKRYSEKAKGFETENAQHGFGVNILKESQDNRHKLSNNEFNVFFDRHGKYVGFIAAAIERENNDYTRLSWEFFDKNNPDFDIIANDKLKHPKISFSKLIESGVHKILVIDERAREAGIKTHPGNWLGQESDADQYSIFAAASRVFIADSFFIDDKEVLVATAKTKNDNSKSTGNGAEQNENDNSLLSVKIEEKSMIYGGKLKDRCPATNAGNFCKFDTLIIHRTMLSKVFNISKEKNYNFFKILDKNFPNIIVTTGGGTLTYNDQTILNRIRIMSFSTAKKYLLNNAIAKNCITNLI